MATSEIPRVLMDSCALLAIIKDEPGAERLDGLMAMIAQGKAQLVESVLVLGEVFKRSDAKDESERDRQDRMLEEVRDLLKSREVQLLDVTPPITDQATQFRRDHGLKLADAVHLATAVLNRCDWFVTFDRDFLKVGDLRIFRIDRLRASTVPLPWDLPGQDPLFDPQSNVVPIRSAER